ncbi:ribosomal biogenesis gtpase, putative [Ichthyophthirius multifiliis]|uniref:Mitochondrial GTPase 1 n=1 Tax=Ichthyophthirius multifiliis TaxID=5932 RepID=G0R6C8_ICHMU|nr:ribosomal biogenesis gtpase, putative [Ichthyophthirius multifiliis]EGR26973.1 ribosomal biogenesis gtpase, putative [Ichthyophthirius multifiliis]|eukprot:XP_004023857.1 ribosomal biogenesis gtpase, putative [Ichthyophthirius multifiliis]
MRNIVDQAPKLGEKISWFPGHMYRALRLMRDKQENIDYFIEIRDSRIPISSRNQEFDDLCQFYNKKKIIVFNKYDLSNQRVINNLVEKYTKVGIDCFSVSALKGTNMPNVNEQILKRIQGKYSTVGIWLMICGMPNVGKSTIINQLRTLIRQKSINKSEATPCTTKSIVGVKISQDPLIYLVDTPGVMIPNIQDDEVFTYKLKSLKLSLVGCIKDVIPGKEIILDYLVYVLNKYKIQKYKEYYGIKQEIKCGDDLFCFIRDKYRHYNYQTTYDMIIDDFRQGKLGKFTMDIIDF